jgi:hypothetical protein
MLQFMSTSVYLSLMWSVPFPCLAPGSSCAILSWVGQLEVATFCPGSRGYLLGQGSMLLNGFPLEQLIAKGDGGSRVCSLLSLVSYPKDVHFASLTLAAKYYWPRRCAPQTKGITVTRTVAH